MASSKLISSSILSRVKGIIGCDANMMNNRGIIVASTDSTRIGTFHAGAAEVIRSGKPVEITEKTARVLTGTKAGLNLPLFINDHVIGVIGITGEPSSVRPYGELVKTMVESMLGQSLLIDQIGAIENARETFLLTLIQGDHFGMDDGFLAVQGKLFGYDLSIPRLCVVFNIDFSAIGSLPLNESKIMKQVANTLKRVFPSNADCISTYVRNGYFVALPTLKGMGSTQNQKLQSLRGLCTSVLNLLGSSFEPVSFVGIGNFYESICDLKTSYKDALKALRIGKFLYKNSELGVTYQDERVYDLSSLGVYVLALEISREEGKKPFDFAIKHESNIRSELGPVLTSTLMQFLLHDMSIRKTADLIHVHRNTLVYRLNRVKEITGKDPRKFSDALQLALVILNESISEPSCESADSHAASRRHQG